MTLKELFQEITDGGWLVNNLYQAEPQLWRCNLRKSSKEPPSLEAFTTYDYGPTPFSALAKAWNQAQELEEKIAKPSNKKTGGKVERYRG